MDSIENILTRTSIRDFDRSKAVSDDDLSVILHSAMAAPSGVDRRPWHFMVIKNTETLDKLAASLPYCHMAAKAPVAIIVCGDKRRFLEGDDSTLWVQDVSASSENILLAAHSLGLGAVWTCLYPHPDRMDAVKKILDLDENFVPFNVIPLGYSDRTHKPRDKWNPDCVTVVQ